MPQQSITPKEQELMQTVLEDLQRLRENWDEEASDSLLRQESILLRYLLIQDGGALFKCAELLGRFLKVEGPFPPEVTSQPINKLTYYQAGGALYKGAKVMACGVYSGVLTEKQIRKSYGAIDPNMQAFRFYTLHEYLQRPCFITEGRRITREKLIRYICNKMGGGGHFELGSLGGLNADLESIRNGNIIADKNAVYYELLAIGQSLVSSKSVKALESELRRIVKS